MSGRVGVSEQVGKSGIIGGVGITHVDTWNLGTGFTGNVDTVVNWVRVTTGSGTHYKWGSQGAPMTYSTGVFTFPAAGLWLVELSVYFELDADDTPTRFLGCHLYISPDGGSNWPKVATGAGNLDSVMTDTSYMQAQCSAIQTCTTSSTVKTSVSQAGSTQGRVTGTGFGSTSDNTLRSWIHFIRLVN